MIKISSFTQLENIDLTAEMGLIQPLDTPLTTLLMAKGQIADATSVTINWREKSLSMDDNISQVEGFTTTNFQQSGRAEKSNVMELFSKAASVSGSAEASNIVGINDLFASEVNDRLTEMKVNVEKKLLSGTYNDGSLTPFIRHMRGLTGFCPTANILKGTDTPIKFDFDGFKKTVKLLWDNGLGNNEFYAFVNADYKETIDDYFLNNARYNMPMDRFGFVVNQVVTNYGIVNLVLNRYVDAKQMIVFDPNFLKLRFLRRPFFEPLAKDGDSYKGQVITETSLQVLNSKSIAMFDGN